MTTIAAARSAGATRWTLTSLSLSMLLSSLGTSIANVGLPTLSEAFNAPFQSVQWVVIAYLLAITALIVSVGRLGDLTGRRRLLLIGIGLFTLASALCAVAPTLNLLIAARALQGLGAAIMMALTLAFVGDAVPKPRIGRAMGMLGTMSAIGTAMGPTLGGLLIYGFGWRAIFLITVPLGLLTGWLAYRWLPADSAKSRARRGGFDVPGTLMFVVMLTAYGLAMTIGRGSFGWLNSALLVFAGVALWMFVSIEKRVASPLIRLEMFRDPDLSACLTMSALVTMVMMATLVVGPFYLSEALELDAVGVGLVMSVGPVVAALTGVPAGRVVDRFGARRMTVSGLAAMVIGCCALSITPVEFGIGGYVVAVAVITLGYALFQTANNTAVMADVVSDQRGVISGLLSLSRNLGLVSGAAALGAVFALASSSAGSNLAHPETIAHGMQTTFAVALMLMGVALVIALRRLKAHGR